MRALMTSIVLIACGGCGPLTMPMPARLDARHQSQVDEAWGRALTPPDHLDQQELLDALLTSSAYQVGVDRLAFRSEKWCDAGLVVMEINFDRLLPEADQFTVTLFDHGGRIARQEQYGRAQIEETYHALFVERAELHRRAEAAPLPAKNQKRLDELQARSERAFAQFGAIVCED